MRSIRATAAAARRPSPSHSASRSRRSRSASRPDLGQPFATWSLAKLADYVVAEGVVTDISHEGLRKLLHEEGVRFQALRTWKRSNDPHFEAKKNRILELYALAEAGAAVVICLDEFWPLQLQPQPGGEAWAPRGEPRRSRGAPHPPPRGPPPLP